MNNNILLLNKANIKSGKLLSLIPEFYELKNVVENSKWHNKESVFDHTLSVLNDLEKILLNLNKGIKEFLNKKIDSNTSTRKDLLKISVLFHDIAKTETIVNNDDGSTLCPDHEEKGSIKTKKILKRFKLSNKEIEFVSNIVKNHYLIHGILTPLNQNFQKEFVNFKERFINSMYWELILLGFADTIGSYLVETYPDEFKSRISFYKKEIKKMPLDKK